MKKILLSLLIFVSLNAMSQNVTKDATGNYISIKTTVKDSATNTGKTFTDTKGNSYPVFISKKGKLFVKRISKSGNEYNMYLKEQK